MNFTNWSTNGMLRTLYTVPTYRLSQSDLQYSSYSQHLDHTLHFYNFLQAFLRILDPEFFVNSQWNRSIAHRCRKYFPSHTTYTGVTAILYNNTTPQQTAVSSVPNDGPSMCYSEAEYQSWPVIKTWAGVRLTGRVIILRDMWFFRSLVPPTPSQASWPLFSSS